MMSGLRTSRILGLALAFYGIRAVGVSAPPSLDEDTPWPRVRSTNGNTITLYLPQVESWTSNSFRAREAVEVKLAGEKNELIGAIWFEANGTVDHENRMVTLDHLEVTKARFPDAKAKESAALAAV